MKENKRALVKEVLTKTKEEKKAYFKNCVVPHTKLLHVSRELKKEIEIGEYNIILVVGPSGVGKSKLFEEIIRIIYEEMSEELELDRSMIPVSGIELPSPDLGKFNWKDVYYRVLEGLNEPLIDKKIDVEKLTNKTQMRKVKSHASGTAPELRRTVEKAFYYRKTKALLIDEAQHFFKTKEKVTATQFNSIKSLANMSNTKIVLFGTYDLNKVINLDGQLSRRVFEIHFPRYDYEDKNDRTDFQRLLMSFLVQMPLEEEPVYLLKEHHRYIYENCIGCAGILKNWLQKCLSDALENNETTITLDNLKRNALQTQKLLTLAEEALSGEMDFVEMDEDRERLKSLLGTKENETKKETLSKKKKEPGKRNPVRDSVG
ncbi:TniB family NTP-binding protein [Bacillaceae bacterium CLA-AA-H227]|uniref:TniB family NTP-binding protein n=1 Tax=Robertmurraya yapensis (ex Hitch et al 2024) TaxID=3133160 RepID=A0ACC6SFI2_9BACI